MRHCKMERLWVAALSVVVGAAIAIVGYYYFLTTRPWSPALKTGTVGLIFAFATAGAAATIIGVVRLCLSRLTTRQAVLSISLGLFCGWGLVIVLPIMPPLCLMPEHRLKVIATGEKNSLSKSPAVWVVGLVDPRTRRFVANAYDFQHDGNWHPLTPEHIFTETAGTMTWNGRANSAVSLKIYASRAGGKVRIVWDGKEQSLDLYAPADPAIPKTILLELSGTPNYWTPKRTLVCLSAAASMAFPLVVICLWLVSRGETWSGERGAGSGRGVRLPAQSPKIQAPSSKLQAFRLPLAWLGYGLPLLFAGAGYLAVFSPALMSNDSLGQWSQMLCGGYTDVAPAFHTMTNWLITRIWFSPAAVAWTQLIAMCLVVAWTLKRLRQWGLSRTWAWTASGLVAIMPAAGILSITLWKDIPYTACMLILALMVMEMIQSNGQWLRSPASVFLLGLVLSLIGLYRHNGLPVALGTPLLLGIPFYRQGLRLVFCLVVACGLIWGVRGPLYQAVAARGHASGTYEHIGMANGQGFFTVVIAVNHIAAQMAAGTPLTAEERDLLNRLYPLEDGKWSYNVHADGRLGLDMTENWAKWEAKENEITALAVRLFRRNPMPSLRRVALTSSYIWCITPSPREGYYTVAFLPGAKPTYQRLRDLRAELPGNVDWVEPRVPLPGFVDWTFRNMWLFWRPALYLYLILFALAVALLRGAPPRLGAFLIPVLLQTGCLALVGLTQEFRYQFPVYMIGLLYGGCFLFYSPLFNPPVLRNISRAASIFS